MAGTSSFARRPMKSSTSSRVDRPQSEVRGGPLARPLFLLDRLSSERPLGAATPILNIGSRSGFSSFRAVFWEPDEAFEGCPKRPKGFPFGRLLPITAPPAAAFFRDLNGQECCRDDLRAQRTDTQS